MTADKKLTLRGGGAIMLVLGYALIWSIGCSPMAVLAHETLGCAGIDSQITLADVDGVDLYGHCYIMVDGRPYEPRYVGLHLQKNIDYDTPFCQYNCTEEFLNDGHDLLPSVTLIIDAACAQCAKMII